MSLLNEQISNFTSIRQPKNSPTLNWTLSHVFRVCLSVSHAIGTPFYTVLKPSKLQFEYESFSSL